jgi:glycogen debranching enzyme
LSRLQLLLAEHQPLLLGSTVADNNILLTADLTNPDLYQGDRLALGRDTIHVARSKYLWGTACHERFAVRNFDTRPHRIRLTVRFECDFADLFEVRGHPRPARGYRTVEVCGVDSALFSYVGLDDVTRQTSIEFDPAPDRLEDGEAVYELTIAPGEQVPLFLRVACDIRAAEKPSRDFFSSLRCARRRLRNETADVASVVSSNAIFNEVMCRSMSDIYMLTSATDYGTYPCAGIPWYCTMFGRDGIITAIQFLWADPEIAKGVLGFLAATQAREENPEADAAPGKILHETRVGEMANLGEVPFRRYYGSVDSTPLFIMLAGMYLERTGDIGTIAQLWPNIEAALAWIDHYGDLDGDGFVEYESQTKDGLRNQGWKDSEDSIFHAGGELATGSIATCEVQGYVYAAKRYAAEMARELTLSAQAATLDHEAELLQERFEGAFWCEEIGFYALALDGRKQPCRVRTSNAGHLLFSGILPQERAERVADTLFHSSFFSGWGIRTVAQTEARYNPMSYHNGSVWPHDNALIGLGLARYNLTHHTQRLLAAMYEAATNMDLRRLPELFCGFRRTPRKGPTYYPVACTPQAWASTSMFALLQAVLGLGFDRRTEEVQLCHPTLPPFLDEVVIRSLRLGTTRMDIMIRRYGADVAVNLLQKEGAGQLAITL